MDEYTTKKERQVARELRKSRWWQNKIANCSCHYCETPLNRLNVTMDHRIPISRGGKSTKSNVVPCCKACNSHKQSSSTVEMILDQLAKSSK